MNAQERYLIDTTVLIDLSRGAAGLRGRLDALSASGADFGVCAVNIAEFISGIPSGEQFLWHSLLGEFQYWNISYETAVLAGAYRHALARRGVTLQLPDALIAATSTTLGAAILTDNVRHFLHIPQVRVRSPRS